MCPTRIRAPRPGNRPTAASSTPPARRGRAGPDRWRWSPAATPPGPPHRRRCRTAPASAARRAPPRRAPARAPAVPPVTMSASSASRRPTSTSARGRPSRSVFDKIGRRQRVQSGDGLQRGALPHADQRGLPAFQRLGDPQRAGQHRAAGGRPPGTAAHHGPAPTRRRPRRPRGLAPRSSASRADWCGADGRPSASRTRSPAVGHPGQLGEWSERIRSVTRSHVSQTAVT